MYRFTQVPRYMGTSAPWYQSLSSHFEDQYDDFFREIKVGDMDIFAGAGYVDFFAFPKGIIFQGYTGGASA